MPEVHLIWKKSCDTCRRYKKQLDAWGVRYTEREMNAAPLDAAEIRALIGARPVKDFLNPRNVRYRELGLKDEVPDADRAAALIAEENNLLRRPVLQVDDVILTGNDLPAAARLLGITP
ncbi:MAG: hypothetical protein KC620_00960 [Myxococcales bacterium]|nr:hypothetical protein [Myxococcales bacterium]